MSTRLWQDNVPRTVDGIFVGGGHNALVSAAYLARAGLSVLVLEGQPFLGGGVSTTEATLPLYRHNLHAFFVRWGTDYRLWEDLDLDRYGVRSIQPEVQNGLPYDGGARALLSYADLGRSLEAIRKLSARDAETYAALHAEFSELTSRVIHPLRFAPPLAPDEEEALLSRSALGKRYLDLARRSAYELVMEAFESEPLRALILFNVAVRGYLPNLEEPGTGYIVPLALPASHQSRIIAGGSADMVRALAAAVHEAGGLTLTDAQVARVSVEQGRAVGVELADGRAFRARRFVASSVPAPITLNELVAPEHLDASLRAELGDYRWLEEALFGVHLALDGLPTFTAAAEEPDLPRALNLALGYESSDDLVRDMRWLQAGTLPEQAALHASISTQNDPAQGPPGGQVTFGWQFVPSRPGGRSDFWDGEAVDGMTRLMLDCYRTYAPDLDERTLAVAAHSPDDTERYVPSMRYGDRHHGSYHPGNWGAARPHPGVADYRTPIEGLYLCGASQHPGGSFTGTPGFNAAGVIAEDLDIAPWWPRPDARTALGELD
jgi:phytoene dehydrogenase-like protein